MRQADATKRPPGRPEIGPVVVARVPQALSERIDALAEADGVTRAEEIRRLLTLGLHQHRIADD